VVSLDYVWIVSYGCLIQKHIRELEQTPVHLLSSRYLIAPVMLTVLLQSNMLQPVTEWLLTLYVPFMFQLSQPAFQAFLSPVSPSYSQRSHNALPKNLLHCISLKGTCTFLISSFSFSSEKNPQTNTTTTPCRIAKHCCFSSEPFSIPLHF